MNLKVKLFSLFLALIYLSLNKGYAQQYMSIKQKDGTLTQILLSDIKKLTFTTVATDLPEQKVKVFQANLKFKAFPNPATDHINIDYELPSQGNAILEVYNISGTLVNKSSLGNQGIGNHVYQYDIRKYPSGTYLLKLRQNNKIINEKVLINP